MLLALATFTFQTLTARAATLENTIYLDLKDGRVVIELWPDVAPKHVERIKVLARQKSYDVVVFHRVIDGFMAQTGDPTGTGMGGSDLPDLPAEFNSAFHVEGTLSMARSSSPDSANSQFFICFGNANFLDGQYTVWGQVVEGMEFVDKLKRGAPGSGSVTNPDHMKKVSLPPASKPSKKSSSDEKKSSKKTKGKTKSKKRSAK